MIDRIQTLVRNVTGRADLVVTEQSHLNDDLGLDSITLVTLAFMCEEEFKVDLASAGDAVVAVRTVGDMIELLGQRGAVVA